MLGVSEAMFNLRFFYFKSLSFAQEYKKRNS